MKIELSDSHQRSLSSFLAMQEEQPFLHLKRHKNTESGIVYIIEETQKMRLKSPRSVTNPLLCNKKRPWLTVILQLCYSYKNAIDNREVFVV